MGLFRDPLYNLCGAAARAYASSKRLERHLDWDQDKEDPYQGAHAIYLPSDLLDQTFPLDAAVLSRMETLFGEDFKSVRIHTGAYAQSLTGKRGASAVTSGRDIYFAAGAYSPDTEEGQRLIAHELEHVRQFRQGLNPGTDEDRTALEGAALRVEALGEDGFHNLERGALSGEGSFAYGEQGGGGALMKGGAEEGELLEDFSGKKRESLIEVVMESTGKRYVITPAEKEAVLRELRVAFEDKLEERLAFAGEDERRAYIERLFEGRMIR